MKYIITGLKIFMIIIMSYWMLKKIRLDRKFKSICLKLEDYDYDGWFTEKE